MRETKYSYALNTSTIRGCGNLSLSQKIKVTAETGYDAVEPWIGELDEFTENGGKPRELRGLLLDYGLSVANLIGFFEWAVPDNETRKQAFKEARRCFQIAAELDCPFLAAPPSGIHKTPGLKLRDIAERYAELIDTGREFGVTPILEFWGIAETLGTLDEAISVVTDCGRQEACILADVFHIYKGTGNFEALTSPGAEKIRIMHVNDYPSNPVRENISDTDRIYPGDGIAPYPKILEKLDKQGFTGTMSVELFNQEYWQHDASDVAATALEKLKALTTHIS